MGIVAFSVPQLEGYLLEYREWLGLPHWTIQLAIRRAWEMGRRHGHVTLLETKRQAFIRLLDPADADPEEMEPYDMEVALVHELWHVALAPFTGAEEGSHEDICQEQAIHEASKSYVMLRRRLRRYEVEAPSPQPGKLVSIRSVRRSSVAL